ncbi:hypothetical protein BIV02_04590 [Curtobacterium sp. MMLR14_014]|uniref:UvrD-helicase domain-containing protein n=1 Tax=unclassified Curtobacterium TaxID=257496 RepID=UPI0008F7FCB9|nr:MULTISPECIES: UvrD-helicase domain-containing protein [unclassified Curtobacterium]OII37719.1 hypothetical protein BIU91_11690 [Curtobacterium sp. MMLR14_002]OII42692.1 hypothetical protein BIV02_04590 [Curtobacterium sp. MMLR14_014]
MEKLAVTVQGVRGTATEDALDAVVRFDRSARSVSMLVGGGQYVIAQGFSRRSHEAIERAVRAAQADRSRIDHAVRAGMAAGAAALAWWADVETARRQDRWADYDTITRLERSRPATTAWSHAAADEALSVYFLPRPAGEREALEQVTRVNLREMFASRNESFLVRETRELAPFFRTVEKSPLTDEQTRAAVCFDNRVRVIASAGSGKTSTMVARAGYALYRGIANPAQILALAFNSKAAAELSHRMKARLGAAGANITSSTFHAFGLRIIGEATGRKPSVPDDLVRDNGLRRLAEVVDTCRDRDTSFRRDWDLFRLVFGRPLRELADDDDPEALNAVTRHDEYRTLGGEDVRSHEEVMIANWLFINGVRYEYERPYEHDVADAHHRQYQPDFYYPDIDTWHEHWAIGADGNAPPHFDGYEASMAWRRTTHQQHHTSLIETTSASIRDGSAFEHLRHELGSRGLVLEENPYREAVGEPPISDKEFIQLLRTFMGHAKGNRLEADQLQRGAGQSLRSRLFLRLYATVLDAWDRRLRAHGQIDFEDMLNMATDHVTSGRWSSPYRVVMVDEMQDTSVARAALVRALVATPGSFLYAVGDDWQSVNRFAGADLNVMTNFEGRFGPGSTVYLSRTFRSPQALCDIAGAFVMRNPRQIEKRMRSAATASGPALRAVSVRRRSDYDNVAGAQLQEIDRSLDGPATVLILGRYRAVKENLEQALRYRYRHLSVEYNTVHASKGKEADYVLIVGMDRKAFPSTIEDDPILHAAMADPDPYPFAEERRLFYVALTRARRQVLLLMTTGRESPFILELAHEGHLTLEAADGAKTSSEVCPRCDRRFLVPRSGRNGEFLGCAGYPRCTYTQDSRKAARLPAKRPMPRRRPSTHSSA